MDYVAQELLDEVSRHRKHTSDQSRNTSSILLSRVHLTDVQIRAKIREAHAAAISANARLTPAIRALERITKMSNDAEENLEAVRRDGGHAAAAEAAVRTRFIYIDNVKNDIIILIDGMRDDIRHSIDDTIEFICNRTACGDLRARTAAVDEDEDEEKLPRKLQILRDFIDSLPPLPPLAAAPAYALAAAAPAGSPSPALLLVPPSFASGDISRTASATRFGTTDRGIAPASPIASASRPSRINSLTSAQRHLRALPEGDEGDEEDEEVRDIRVALEEAQRVSDNIDYGRLPAHDEEEAVESVLENSNFAIDESRKKLTRSAVSGLLANVGTVSRRASGSLAPAGAAAAAAEAAAGAAPAADVFAALLETTFPSGEGQPYNPAAAVVPIKGGFEILSGGLDAANRTAHTTDKYFCDVFFFNACLSFLDPHSHDPVFPSSEKTSDQILRDNLLGYQQWFYAAGCDYNKFEQTVTTNGRTYCDANAKKVVAALASELRVKLGIDIEEITEDITTDEGLEAFTTAFRTFAAHTPVRLVIDSIAGGTRFEQFVEKNRDRLFMRYGPHEMSDPGPAKVKGLRLIKNDESGSVAYFPSWALTFGDQTRGTLRIYGDYVIKDYKTIYGRIELRLLKGGRGASNAEMGKLAECFSSRKYEDAYVKLNNPSAVLGTKIDMCDGFTLARNITGYTIASKDGKYQITFDNIVAGQPAGIVSAICCDAKHQGDYGKQTAASNADGDSDGEGSIKRALVTVEKLGKEAVSALANQYGGTIHLLQNGQATLCIRQEGGNVAIPTKQQCTMLLQKIGGILQGEPGRLFTSGSHPRLNADGLKIVKNARVYAMSFLTPLVSQFEQVMRVSNAENKQAQAERESKRLAASASSAGAGAGAGAGAASAAASAVAPAAPPAAADREQRAGRPFESDVMKHQLYALIVEYTQADAGVAANKNLSLSKAFSDPYALLKEGPQAFAAINRLYTDADSYYKSIAGIDIDELCRKLRIIGGNPDDFLSSQKNFVNFYEKNIDVFEELFGSANPVTREGVLKQRACSGDILRAIAFFYISIHEHPLTLLGLSRAAASAAPAAAPASPPASAAPAAGEDDDDWVYSSDEGDTSSDSTSLMGSPPARKRATESSEIAGVLEYAKREVRDNSDNTVEGIKLYARKHVIAALLGITLDETGLDDDGGGAAAASSAASESGGKKQTDDDFADLGGSRSKKVRGAASSASMTLRRRQRQQRQTQELRTQKAGRRRRRPHVTVEIVPYQP